MNDARTIVLQHYPNACMCYNRKAAYSIQILTADNGLLVLSENCATEAAAWEQALDTIETYTGVVV